MEEVKEEVNQEEKKTWDIVFMEGYLKKLGKKVSKGFSYIIFTLIYTLPKCEVRRSYKGLEYKSFPNKDLKFP